MADRRYVVAAGLGLALLVGLAAAWRMGVMGPSAPAEDAEPAPTAASTSPPGFVGSAACRECHTDEYQRWQSSQHAVAMQVADEQTVLGDFTGTTFKKHGVTSEFFRRDGKFDPLQQYLVELPGGRVQALSIAWDARPKDQGGQRWFHLYPSERITNTDELHWTQRQQNWNFMCSDCHSTGVRKNFDAAAGTFATQWAEISVGCEACHGPGSNHVALARAAQRGDPAAARGGLTVTFDERKGIAWVIDPATGNASRSAPRESSHADGQQLDEVFNWGSFLSSRMHEKGVTCSDCHDPHGGKPHAPGNAVCAQCHSAAKYDAPSHHFHEPGTAGAACASCHMKPATYMVVDPRHDHSFRIPRPDRTVSLGTPNACNHCHADRTAEWAAAEIRNRYPDPKPGFQGFAEAFASADRGDPAAVMALVQVAANLDESAIARASAIDRLARLTGENALFAAEAGLKDSSPLVRRASIAVFEQLPPLQRKAIVPLLVDPSRIVRMQAARTLAPLADDAFDPAALEAFRKAAAEYVAAERFNADRPEHRTNLGGFLAERGEAVAAEAEYRAALALDPRFVPAWANLADLQRLQGREVEVEATLREGLKEVPDAAALHHSLGLSLVRQQRKAEALRELSRATELEPGNARYKYVYDVAVQELGPRG